MKRVLRTMAAIAAGAMIAGTMAISSFAMVHDVTPVPVGGTAANTFTFVRCEHHGVVAAFAGSAIADGASIGIDLTSTTGTVDVFSPNHPTSFHLSPAGGIGAFDGAVPGLANSGVANPAVGSVNIAIANATGVGAGTLFAWMATTNPGAINFTLNGATTPAGWSVVMADCACEGCAGGTTTEETTTEATTVATTTEATTVATTTEATTVATTTEATTVATTTEATTVATTTEATTTDTGTGTTTATTATTDTGTGTTVTTTTGTGTTTGTTATGQNPPTGVAIVVIPTLVAAAAAVIVARKRK